MYEQRKQPVALVKVKPPVFFQKEFKPLASRSIWVFSPIETARAIELHKEWGVFCKNPEPGGNYFSIAVMRLRIVDALLRARNNKRCTRWKLNTVCYRAISFANRPAWGNFVRLVGLPPQSSRGICLPSMISLILPQALTGIKQNGEKLINEQYENLSQ